MRFHLFLASAIILGLVFISEAMAGDDDHDDHDVGQQAFVGLWQAIDSSDGSTQLLSITCSRGGACDVRLNDTAFTLSCPMGDIGFAQGVGRIKRRVLTVDLTLTCTNSNVVTDAQLNKFVLDRRNGTLTNRNDDNLEFPNVFHKISNLSNQSGPSLTWQTH